MVLSTADDTSLRRDPEGHSPSAPVPAWPAARMAETHISWVFFVGDRAYKLKKPVRTSFLDFTTVENRRLDCELELALNRRLAPDVYEGIATVTGPSGEVCDHLLVMRRMPDDRRLSSLIRARTADVDVRRWLLAIACRLAEFHAASDVSAAIEREGSVERVRQRWATNVEEVRRFVPTVLDRATVDEVERLSSMYLAGREWLFAGRIAEGRIVDGHGDLLADDIFCLDDGPRLLDCLEFDEQLRWGDGLADAAFLAMDLERLGRGDLSTVFLSAYQAASRDQWPQSLAHHYIAYRALIRSKVACIRSEQNADVDPGARELLDLARAHLRAGAVRLVLVGGLPGTGKTTVATALGRRRGWHLLRSDVVRKELAGDRSGGRGDEPYRSGLYDESMTARVYDELLVRAGDLLRNGESVVLDASWNAEHRRRAAYWSAAQHAANLIELRCTAPAEVAAARITDRIVERRDASDATPEVAEAMAGETDVWPSAVVLDTAESIDDTVAAAEAATEREAAT